MKDSECPFPLKYFVVPLPGLIKLWPSKHEIAASLRLRKGANPSIEIAA